MLPVGRRFKIATFAGIPFYLTTSWLVLAAFVTFSEYDGISRSALRLSDQTALMLALASAGLFFGSILLHEGAHAFVARRLKLPVWGVTLIGWGGYTETPAAARGPMGEFVVSAAGPVMNGLLGVGFLVAESMLHLSHPLAADMSRRYGWLNLIVGALNALPGLPLDGGRVLMAVIWRITRDRSRAMLIGARGGYVVAAVIAAYGFNQIDKGEGAVIWPLFIAYVLFSAARQSEARVKVRRALADATVADAMAPAADSVPASMSLSEALDHYLRDNPQLEFAVVDTSGAVIGTVSLESARKIGARDPMRPVRDALIRGASVPTLEEDMQLADAIDLLSEREGMVVRDGRPVGRISLSLIQSWFETRAGGSPQAAVPPRPDI